MLLLREDGVEANIESWRIFPHLQSIDAITDDQLILAVYQKTIHLCDGPVQACKSILSTNLEYDLAFMIPVDIIQSPEK